MIANLKRAVEILKKRVEERDTRISNTEYINNKMEAEADDMIRRLNKAKTAEKKAGKARIREDARIRQLYEIPLVEVPFFKTNNGERCRLCEVRGEEWAKLIRESKIKRRSPLNSRKP